MRTTRLIFSLKGLFAFVTLVAVILGAWIGYSRFKVKKLTELRQQGAIIILRDRTPQLLQSIGIRELSPFFDVPTVELYVTPNGGNAFVGDSETVTTNAQAKEQLLQQATVARSYGAEDIQLILVDGSTPEWRTFAKENGFKTIGERKQRYMKRLAANRESGANINP